MTRKDKLDLFFDMDKLKDLVIEKEYVWDRNELGKNMITDNDIENWFMYHAPDAVQQSRYAAIRESARKLAFVIIQNTPQSADQTAAIRSLRLAVMQANAAIACEE